MVSEIGGISLLLEALFSSVINIHAGREGAKVEDLGDEVTLVYSESL